MPNRYREEVLNTVLGLAIVARGLNADPETIRNNGKARPDVFIQFRGLRCVIEGKVADVADARAVVLGDAISRLEKGIAHIAIAVVYPKELRGTGIRELFNACIKSQLDFAVVTERGPGPWSKGSIDEILNELRRAHDQLSRDDLVQEVAEKLNAGLQEVAQILVDQPGVPDRLIDLLGIGERGKNEEE